MDFAEWLTVGIDNGWATKPICATHEGVPTTEAEDNQWEEGEDPCAHVIRLVDSPEMLEDIAKNYPPNYIK